jgi:SIR2-like domain
VKVVMLLGSGSSQHAGMPSVDQITARVLSGENAMSVGGAYRMVERLPPNHEIFNQELPKILRFVEEVEQLCDEYFESQAKERTTNYEDIAYVARQVADGLTSEYENPALLPLNRQFGAAAGRSLYDLKNIASASADYVDDIVRSLLGKPAQAFDHLTAIVDAIRDDSVGELTIATLNHDVVLERAFAFAGVKISDGFEKTFGTLEIWNDQFSTPNRKLLKLHGSIDWWRFTLNVDGWEGQFTARTSDGDAEHARGPDGELLDYPAMGRPLFLTGTFNKILSYQSGIYADQHYRFHEALMNADALVVIGYGFRDKAINSRIVAWAERPGERRMIVVHPRPDGFGETGRGAIRNNWARWQNRGLLAFVREYLTPETTWASMRDALQPDARPSP